MSERGWGRVWHGHSLPAGTAPPVPSSRRGGEEEEGDEEDAAVAPPAPRCAAPLRARRSAAAPARRGRGSPREAPGAGLGASALPKLSRVWRAAVPGVPRQPSLPCPVPRACGQWCGRDVAQRVFPQPLLSSDRALSAPIATW